MVLLDDALATFECVTHSTHEAGDHTLVVGEVLDLGHADEDAAPLLYFRGRYHDGWH